MRIFFCLFFILTINTFAVFPQKTDPYFSDSGGFGKTLINDKLLSAWWCEGAYKIMKDTPQATKTSNKIRLEAARNEYEPFQLVLRSSDTIQGFNIKIDKLRGPDGEISSDNFEFRLLEYVYINKPSDSYAYEGYWPDPLPLMGDSITILPGENTTIWINLHIPPASKPGTYSTSIYLESDTRSYVLPLSLKVWDFTLPDTSSVRSGFGLSVDKIAAYHNISDSADLRQVFDMYMQSFRDYKIAPYSFYYLSQIKKRIGGLKWSGGFYDTAIKYDGDYAIRLEDNLYAEDRGLVYSSLIDVSSTDSYSLEWFSKSLTDEQEFTVVLDAFTSGDSLLRFESRAEVFSTKPEWSGGRYSIGSFSNKVAKIRLSLYPVFRTGSGENTGTVWFDNLSLLSSGNDNNLIKGGDFEIEADSIDLTLDFSEFDKSAKRYLDEFGFNAFRLNLEGMGSGTYFSRNEGVFEAFENGTAAYSKLMKRYLKKIQDHLAENGWLGKEYIYWFDEPGEKDYPFVREGMELIKTSAPGLTTFLTENSPGPEIMDVTDISCTILNRIDPLKVKEVIDNGGQYWSYICTGPKAPWISEFIDHDAINLRMWLWMSYDYDLSGILVWSTNYWTSRSVSGPDYLQNPWTEAASYVQGYGWPLGKLTNWGNGDGRFFYPPNRMPNIDRSKYIEGPVPSLRLEFLRQGIEDYEYFVMLESLINNNKDLDKTLVNRAVKLLEIPEEIFSDGKNYTKDPVLIYEHRRKVAELIERINKSLHPVP